MFNPTLSPESATGWEPCLRLQSDLYFFFGLDSGGTIPLAR
jgi:hypothetical protein